MRHLITLSLAVLFLATMQPKPALATEIDLNFLMGGPSKELCEYFRGGYQAAFNTATADLDQFVKDKDVGQKKKASIEDHLKEANRWGLGGKPLGDFLVAYIRDYIRLSEGLTPEQLEVFQSRFRYNDFLWKIAMASVDALQSNDSYRGDAPDTHPRKPQDIDRYLRKGIVTWTSTESIETPLGTAKRVTVLSLHIDAKEGTYTVKIDSSDIQLPKLARFDDYAADRFKQDKLSDCVQILGLNTTVSDAKTSDASVKPGETAPAEKPAKRHWWQRKKSRSVQ